MAFDEDLDDLFDVSEFAVTATFGANSFPVILDEHYDDDLEIEGMHITATCTAANAALLTEDQAGTIAGRAVIVRSIQPDGTGCAHLMLEEQ